MNMIPILKTGNYTDAQGHNYEITNEILLEIASQYTPSSAPLVKGHPHSDAPAMGWVNQLKVMKNRLYASFTDISEEFKKDLSKKLFKNVSASLYLPTSSSNPTPGKYTLRHVGALGAARPAIPNLGDLQSILSFAESYQDEVILFSEEDSFDFKKIWNQFISAQNIESSIDKIDPLTHISIKLIKANQEIKTLKQQLREYQIVEEINKEFEIFIQDKDILPEQQQVLYNIMKNLTQHGIEAKEITASFSEFFSVTEPIVHTHRFDTEISSDYRGIAEFSEHQNIENSELFANEVDQLSKQGLSRQDAFKQAKINLRGSLCQ